ncbi:hypothetical protein BMJ20_29660 [Sinorhizobium medicae]|uniref:Transposase n=1 Tax=Sinorhizobium medicae TaxID=110321 RepID=A0ABX4TG07_9HYPH|nr:hypothetical protein BMJ33_26640 [Sinorhizobium medicae]PLU25282.1 hypothetical protein BMJ31_10515 [Sinorhizobium medicae]PLU65748.1 hypothetical protein BMJ20_29660 [Sinorhizobium medicae]
MNSIVGFFFLRLPDGERCRELHDAAVAFERTLFLTARRAACSALCGLSPTVDFLNFLTARLLRKIYGA